jgi:hypothetical protein
MNDHSQIKFLLKEAGMYIQFLNEDLGSVESVRENVGSRIEQLLKQATKKLRESANLLNLEVRGGRKK